jgi:hypothetical protein
MEKIIIFFHIYYVDLLDEYLWYLNNIKTVKYSFDLYVSICDKSIDNIIVLNLNGEYLFFRLEPGFFGIFSNFKFIFTNYLIIYISKIGFFD